MHSLKDFASQVLKINPEQAQVFTPTPSTYSTLMYYTGLHYKSRKPIFIEKDIVKKEKQKQSLLQKRENKPVGLIVKGEIMSVLMEFSMFSLQGKDSKSAGVARIIEMIHDSGYAYTLTPMGTIIETESLVEALRLVEYSYAQLDEDERVYASIKLDIRLNHMKNLTSRPRLKRKSLLK